MATSLPKSLVLSVGETRTISAKITPTDATNKSVIWSTCYNKIVMLSGGTLPGDKMELIVYAERPGETTVNARIVEFYEDLNAGRILEDSIKVKVVSSEAFWCQTGGWFGEGNNGNGECARTAVATMASINANATVYPSDVFLAKGITNKVIINGQDYIRGNYGGYFSYDDFIENGILDGFNGYLFSNNEQILEAINYELSNGRVVVVYTNGAGGHWVTVTGTITGQPATQFSDLIGIDPWFNGTSPPNPSVGSGDGSSNAEKSGVIHLLNAVDNQTDFHLTPQIFTFKI